MIRAWRLCQAAHQATAFTGEGARLYGGRWNPRGLTAIYTAATQSLAALEILVHVDTDLIANDYIAFPIDLPTRLVETIKLDDLPENWHQPQQVPLCQALGDEWLARNHRPVLAVPSAIIPEETNYVLNPQHPHFAKITVHPGRRFTFDQRLWKRE